MRFVAERWRRGAVMAATGTLLVAAPVRGQQPDLAPWFAGSDGAFVLHELRTDRTVRYNAARCAERFSPCSTFKVPNALIGLETGVVRDAETVKKWSPALYDHARPAPPPYDVWMRDHTLRSAMKYSVVWYFQEIARAVGQDRYSRFLEGFDYGNRDISAGLDRFWLSASLKISADEQIAFLEKMYLGKLPVSPRSAAIVKDILVIEDSPSYRLSGKTGTGPLSDDKYLGWLVGYVEQGSDVSFFALNLEGPTYDAISKERRLDMTKGMLRALGALPPESAER